MIAVALKMLFHDKLKYLGLVMGVSFAALLICQQLSILVGLTKQTGSFIRDTAQADLWIMDDQVRFSQDSLPMRDTTLQLVRGIAGVEWAVPLYQGFIRGQMPDGSRFTLILVGLDDATLMGGPPLTVVGSLGDLRRDRAVLINNDNTKNLMMKRGGDRALTVGDRFSINDSEAVVVGTYRGRPSFFWEPVMYTTYSRALAYAPPQRNQLTYILVKTKPGADLAAIKQAVRDKTDLSALTNDEFVDKTADYILNSTGILVNFGIAVALGFFIGLLVAGQTLYNFTLDNLRHYGALKAMGVSNFTLAKMVLAQSLTTAGIGYGLGVGMASGFGVLLKKTDLAFSMPWWIPAFTFVSILAICAVAGFFSLRRVFKLEPAVVFKA